MSFNEAVVRTNIAKFLCLIEDGLELVKEEFHLPNVHGTSGYIDILAKDKVGRLVVVEIKISKHSERDAITELFKYITLLKQRMSLKDSDIRLIVVSTDWRELLTPFSEFCWNTNYNSAGYMAVVDSGGFPLSITPIQLLSRFVGRKLIPRHWIQVYDSDSDAKSKRDAGAVLYGAKIDKRGIKNFVIVYFSYSYPSYGVSGYGFYFAQQEENLQLYQSILKSVCNERFNEILSYTKTLTDPEDILNEFADAATDMIDVPADELDIGSPEKIKSYLENKSWTVEKIRRYGVFSQDIRLTDQEIIDELCGYTGGSYTWFSATCHGSNKSYFNEIKSKYSGCLYHNDGWRTSIRDVMDYFEGKGRSASMHLNIFNPENILETVALLVKTGDQSYLPNFAFVIEDDEKEELEVFQGEILIERSPRKTVSELGDDYFEGNISNAPMVSFLHGMAGINSRIMADLGLSYAVKYYKLSKGDAIASGVNPKIRGQKVIFDELESEGGLVDWLDQYADIASDISSRYLSAIITVEKED